MATLIKKSLDAPDEELDFGEAKAQRVRLGRTDVIRVVAAPGYRYYCDEDHRSWLVLSGRLRVRLDDGSEEEFGPGDVGVIPPGHDSWVVGDETLVGLDIQPGESSA